MCIYLFSKTLHSCINRLRRYIQSHHDWSDTVSYMSMITALVNFLLIAIVNPSLLNPGPSSLTVLYQNVQSFLHPYSAGNTNPDLDRKKLSNFQGHVAFTKPDIIVLNETWLKSSINSNVILSDTQYKVYRKDRSKWSHPPNPGNKAIRENGGGVLIAGRNDLDVVLRELKMHSGAEMLAVEITRAQVAKKCHLHML